MEAGRDNRIKCFCVRLALTLVVMKIDGIDPSRFFFFVFVEKYENEIRNRIWRFFVCAYGIPCLSGIHSYSSHNKTSNMLNRHTKPYHDLTLSL
jgi:hypothetical protein